MEVSTETNTLSWFPVNQAGQQEIERLFRTDTVVSDQVIRVVEIAVNTVLCGVISASGLIANVINVIVFFRQGALSSSSNVSLLALALADIGSLIPLFCNSVNYALYNAGLVGLFLTPNDFFITLVLWPHIMCMQIASWITAYIAFERSLCVILPLKVKSLFSAKKSLGITTTIAVIVIISFIPTYVTQKTAKMSDSVTNTTKIVAIETGLYLEVTLVSDFIHSITLRPVALVIVFVCTHITIYRVKLSTSWRKSILAMTSSSSSSTTNTPKAIATSPGNKINTRPQSTSNKSKRTQCVENSDRQTVNESDDKNNSNSSDTNKQNQSKESASTPAVTKETRLIKMITVISSIFMVCNAPFVLGVLVFVSQMPTLGLTPADNVFFLVVSSMLCLESINSSINIFVYYRMSTSYRQTFLAMLGKL